MCRGSLRFECFGSPVPSLLFPVESCATIKIKEPAAMDANRLLMLSEVQRFTKAEV